MALPSSALAQQNDDKKQPKRSKAEADSTSTLCSRPSSGDRRSGRRRPSATCQVGIEPLREASRTARTYVPFTLQLDRTELPSQTVAALRPGVGARCRGAGAGAEGSKDKDKAPRAIYPWDNVSFAPVAPDGRSRAFRLKAGGLRRLHRGQGKGAEKTPKKHLIRRSAMHEDVDDRSRLHAAELATSSVILARPIEPLQAPLRPAQQEEPLRLRHDEDRALDRSDSSRSAASSS